MDASFFYENRNEVQFSTTQRLTGARIQRTDRSLAATITTILGVMPLIVWRDPLFFTLAIIIAFGLAFGTVLTLGVVPVLYSLLFRIRSPHAA
ncbi:MAG: efflux RND transporter permease subunit [Deltaproteobacteria bacterium]|nr:MAG: efflux RND transporter permease subunit [Deltaproteobacteria bacterium]